jgi:hypothetical protein
VPHLRHCANYPKPSRPEIHIGQEVEVQAFIPLIPNGMGLLHTSAGTVLRPVRPISVTPWYHQTPTHGMAPGRRRV